MIQLKNITKTYKTGEFVQQALNGVSLNFRESEFVAILGHSGSGKTTFLNVLGGLDRYDSGDLIINGRSTKKFKASDWDAYRNNSVGFIFQSYNLISHLDVLDNVEMGMTLSGVHSSEKHKRAKELLTKVGLEQHIHKKPNQLSGGQMQRVAIARALANDPDIILADEPTGALDSETSEQIMSLIKEISKDKLVVMVTHNPDIAEEYADRVVRFSDGKLVGDTNPPGKIDEVDKYSPKKTSMSFWTALKLSGKNILTKKGRTALTAFASSIGIIGVALVLALSNGFDIQIDKFEKESLANFPVTIYQNSFSIETAMARQMQDDRVEFPDEKVVNVYDRQKNTMMHDNVITKEYCEYIDKMDSEYYDGIAISRIVNMNILKMEDDKASSVDTAAAGFSTYPIKEDSKDYGSYFSEYYDVLAGELPKNETDLVLVINQYNQLELSTIKALGFDGDAETISFDDIVGMEYKMLYNDDYYIKSGDYYSINGNASDLTDLYNNANAVTLKICGVVRIKEDTNLATISSGIAFVDDLALSYIEDAKESEIVKAQQDADYDVLSGNPFMDEETAAMQNGGMGAGAPGMGAGAIPAGAVGEAPVMTKESMLAWLGADSMPASISIYPVDFTAKESITKYLDDWNSDREEDDRVEYTDMAAMITSLSGTIMDAITIVLVTFAAISLVVSMIMIAIIIYISVLERTREIGVLRALGARGKDITRVFNAETFIIGACSGILGISIAYLLTIPANSILYNLTELENVAQLNPVHAAVLVLISIVLTLIGGFIPSKMAARKDPVEALRTE